MPRLRLGPTVELDDRLRDRSLSPGERGSEAGVDLLDIEVLRWRFGRPLDEQPRPEHVDAVDGEGAADERPVGFEEAQHAGDGKGDIVESRGHAFYLRLQVADEAGVLANITRILAERAISIDAVLQRPNREAGAAGKHQTDLIILTHDTLEGHMNDALAKMQALPSVLAPIVRIRKEELS